jgi:diaminopimelate decarboxylase
VMVDGNRFAIVAERLPPEATIAAEHVPDWLMD